MAVGSRRRSSWIMASTSCLVRMPLRSSRATEPGHEILGRALQGPARTYLWVSGASNVASEITSPSVARNSEVRSIVYR